ncbi:hypothetical protein HYW32_00095 [Candidatus Berkelbacteria bacterium]|nr:hypothetical protein [Candidatus Berkelbacteria bacterium]
MKKFSLNKKIKLRLFILGLTGLVGVSAFVYSNIRFPIQASFNPYNGWYLPYNEDNSGGFSSADQDDNRSWFDDVPNQDNSWYTGNDDNVRLPFEYGIDGGSGSESGVGSNDGDNDWEMTDDDYSRWWFDDGPNDDLFTESDLNNGIDGGSGNGWQFPWTGGGADGGSGGSGGGGGSSRNGGLGGSSKGTTLPPSPKVVITPISEIDLKSVLNVDSIETLVTSSIPNILIILLGLVTLVFFMINAFRYLLGAGDTDATKEAKNGMLFAIMGAVVVLTAYGILEVLKRFIE